MTDDPMAGLPEVASNYDQLPGDLELGAFSISLSVANLEASETFYRKLGFERTGGDGEHWLIMFNGESMIGLFQGLFEGNVLTFNPGLTNRMERLGSFTNVRDVQRHLESEGIELIERAEDGTGPAHVTLVDPDGNAILIDQHF
jgi:catechol 2,3-dioxygenase-like lactoylglutathione lyase family enzyme